MELQGCIWAAPFGEFRRKTTTGALFGKQCARLFTCSFENIVSCLLGQFGFFVYNVHYAGWPASRKITINFVIQENQRISLFLEKIRDTPDGFIMDKGKDQGYMIFLFDFPENVLEL